MVGRIGISPVLGHSLVICPHSVQRTRNGLSRSGTLTILVAAAAGIQETAQNVLSWTLAYAGETKDFTPSG